MSQAWQIRRGGLTDVKALLEIERLSFASPWSLWCFLAEVSNPVSHTLLIGPSPPQSWQTWGYIIFWVVAQEMHILNLAVHPRHRRQGLARALLRAALAKARDLDAKAAWLEVRPSNQPARALYTSFGFQEVGYRPHYYADNREAALILSLSWQEEEVQPPNPSPTPKIGKLL
ncbi:MAG: ribosomal protein S18-alanine N-acetyltransferase [Thermodesulfobacteriota bacterium]